MEDRKTFEERMLQSKDSLGRMGVNTPTQIERAHYYYERYYQLRARQEERYAEWNRLSKLYRCERDDYDTTDEAAPKSFCPIVTPVIEGQMAALVEYNMSISVMGAGPTDNDFAKALQYGTDFIVRNNQLKQFAKDFVRDYLLLGNAWLTVWWDKDAYNGLGIPRLRVPTVTKVYVDGRIKDSKDLQYAEYIIEEIGYKSIGWAKREYGAEIADAIVRMNNNPQFEQQDQRDDIDSFMLLHVWTRNNEQGNLQLIEMTTNPLILRESDPSRPYYEFCDNQYPFAFARLYKKPLDFYGFGDGRLLEPTQRTINKLFDELEIACRFQAQARTFVDPTAEMDDDQLDSDPSHPIMARNPNQTIRVLEGRGINPVVMDTINMLMAHAERATRFSSVMTGMETQNSVSATQSGIMLQQGNVTINDKKSDIAQAIEFIVKYFLKMSIELFDRGFWTRVGDKNTYSFIDFSEFAEVPVAIPATAEYMDQFRAANPDKKIPYFETVMEDDGSDIARKSIDYDVQVSLGEGLPHNRVAVHNVLMNLYQLQIIDRERFVKLSEQYLGLDLDSAEMFEKEAAEQAAAQAGGMVNPASETSVGVPMGAQASATSNPDMAGVVPGGGALPMRSAGAV